MAETIDGSSADTGDRAGPVRRASAHFSVWDRVMRFSDIGLGAWSIIMFIFLYLPIVVLVIYSFNDQKLNVYWTHFTTKWYWASNIEGGKSVLHDPDVINAF